ncbi:MAG: hypothetical protein Q7T45_16125 [Bradyrhizobium sp.]|uniref:hypothetical protein n=1 Tax=Bradyrhizobium sp. TaxID=376 RepID=UPI00271F1615|nr:hypothetical protein [Bradyrhizobium sp.]MDO8399342.1 hypothetical protein [Bradyrhizobium sp.]
MGDYIHDENLKLFRKRLAEAADEKQRQTLRDLIKQEAAKIAARGSANPSAN